MALQKVNRNLLNTGVSDSSDATAITIDSNENVGFGVTPRARLDIFQQTNRTSKTGTTRGVLHLQDGDTAANNELTAITFESNSNNASAIIGQSLTNNGSELFFGTSNGYASGVTNTAMIINPSGNVGIGTNPDKLLHLAASSGATLRLESTTTGATTGDIFGAIEFETQDSNSAGVKGKIDSYSEGGVGNAALRFFTGNTTELGERMRIDSSGKVGIATSTNHAGSALGYMLTIDSEGASGSIFEAHRTGNSRLEIYQNATGGNYIDSLGTTAFTAFATGGTERMRILNGGGLTFNGDTAAANALDDYEEGVFAPSFTLGSGSVTPYSGYTNLGYTKVGRVVTITGMIALQSVSSPSGSLTIGNLPFAMNSPSNRAGLTRPTIHVYCSGSGAPVVNKYYVGFIAFGQNSTSGTLIITHGSGDQDSTPGDWFAAGSDLFINFTYIAAT